MISKGFQRAGAASFGLIPLDIAESELERLTHLLTCDEMARANRLLDPEKGRFFRAGRGMMRELLGELTGDEPGSIRIDEGDFGKPYLPDHREISFSLSHSGGFLLFACAEGKDVGVDLEMVREELDFVPMAKRYFSQREQEELHSLPWQDQRDAFYRCWTRKEAYIKGTGSGFSQPSTSFDVSLLPAVPPALLGHRADPAEVGRWDLHDLPTPEGYCASIAIRTTRP